MREGRYLDFKLENQEIEEYTSNLEELVEEDTRGRKQNVYNQIEEYLNADISSQEDLEEFLGNLSNQSIGAAGGNVTLHDSERDIAIDIFETAYEMLD